MSNKINIKNPYLYTSSDFSYTETFADDDLVDSSGYLTLQDQISIITNQSEINNEFRRGMIDNFNNEKFNIIEQLQSFEDDTLINEQLLKAHSGDLLDKEQILQNAYELGLQQYFFPHQSVSSEGDTSTLVADVEKKEVKTDTDK